MYWAGVRGEISISHQITAGISSLIVPMLGAQLEGGCVCIFFFLYLAHKYSRFYSVFMSSALFFVRFVFSFLMQLMFSSFFYAMLNFISSFAFHVLFISYDVPILCSLCFRSLLNSCPAHPSLNSFMLVRVSRKVPCLLCFNECCL